MSNKNELYMRTLGATRHLKQLDKKKNVFESSAGQKAIIKDVDSLLPEFKKHCKKKQIYKKFEDEDDFLIKTIETVVFLCGNIGTVSLTRTKGVFNKRYYLVKRVNTRILNKFDHKECFKFVEGLVHFSKILYKKSIFKNVSLKKDVTIVCYRTNIGEDVMLDIMESSLGMFAPMPMIKKPVNWKATQRRYHGGYETEQFSIIRRIKSSRRGNKELKGSVMSFLDDIQSVPWKINVPVLEQLKSDVKKPQKEEYVKTMFPEHLIEGCRFDVDISELEQNDQEVQDIISVRTEYFAQRAKYSNEVSSYKSDLGKWVSIRDAIFVAEHYLNDTIYFPHNYDYRGRVYPIPTKLSPQGGDAAKGILLFAQTEPLTARGILWNWSYLASLYGNDKDSFEQRVEIGKGLLDADYRCAEEPYQFLSHQLEIKKWVEDPTYVPNTRVHLDACNSGSQFTSMLTGDVSGCTATNVIPTIVDGVQKRKDAYLLVANKTIEYIREELNAGAGKNEEFLNAALDFMLTKGRKVCKKPVMVSNYGGTDGGRVDIVRDMFKRFDFDLLLQSGANARILSNLIGNATRGVLKGGKHFESYIQQMSDIFAANNLDIIWETDDGFLVNGSKKQKVVDKKIQIRITGTDRVSIYTEMKNTNKVDKRKTKLSISPNYIHSLDAELLRNVARRVFKITPYSAWIHDSFGVHPNNVDVLLKITKEEFFKMAKKDPLKKLHKGLCAQLPDDLKTNNAINRVVVPQRQEGFLEQLKGVFNSEYFFS